MMIGGLNDTPVDCCGQKVLRKHVHPYSEAWAVMDCDCLEHTVARLWFEATSGTSYRVQVDKVYNSRGTGKYLSKYFAKTFAAHQRMEDAGFTNRFAFSRNFPKLDKLQMAGTKSDSWGHVEIIDRKRLDFRQLSEYYRAEVQRMQVNRPSMMAQEGEEYLKQELVVQKAKKFLRLVNENVP